jgi:3'-phosphoadenosine 5'-phosphosulfate sulfotransferase (PAPS reductase)/FAD synthetase
VIESVQKGRSPFCIEGPALISFSGGRTSAYMLRRILDEGLQPDVHIVFADTGRERPETYEFVTRCAEEWGVEVHWVHRPGYFEPGKKTLDLKSTFRYHLLKRTVSLHDL